MKLINTLITILFISLLSSPSWSLTLDDLVERDGLYYKKFTETPFTGEVTGDGQGSIRNGKIEGVFVTYHENGQLKSKGNYTDGKREGEWVTYHENGQFWHEGIYKNDRLDQDYWFAFYNTDGYAYKLKEGSYKKYEKISD